MITEACGTKREGADPCTCGNRLFCFANFQAALTTRDIQDKGVRLAAGLRKGRLCAEASNNDLSPARSGDTNKGSVPSPAAAGVRGDEFMGEVAPPCYPAICGFRRLRLVSGGGRAIERLPSPAAAGRVRADNTGASVHQIHRFRRIPWRAAVSDPEKANPKQTLLSARHGLSAGWSVCFFDIAYAVMPAGRIRPAPLGFATFSAPARTCRSR